MREATNDLMNAVTPYGKLLVDITLTMNDGSVHTDFAVNPFAFLFHAYKEDGPFRRLIDGACEDGHGCADDPLKIVIYADEVVPGKELSHNNKRKQWCMYWSLGSCCRISTWKKLGYRCLQFGRQPYRRFQVTSAKSWLKHCCCSSATLGRMPALAVLYCMARMGANVGCL